MTDAANPDTPQSILLVEDEDILRQSMAELLESEGFAVSQAANGRQAYQAVLERPFDLVISDVRMPEMDGLALLADLKKLAPQMPVIVVTAYGTVESAVAAMRQGAYDYLLKPVNFDDLLLKVQRALDHSEMARTKEVMTEQLASQSTFHDLVGESRAMGKLFDMVRKLSTVKSSVLIVGESGTGKELFARAIHFNGITRDKPFVAVNCGAIPESLIESELFGHRRGAFTGAIRDKMGYFEAANRGTLFLDEISTLPVSVQSSLLRVLEDRTVTPVGDTKSRPVDVRIIAASNRDLDGMVKRGEFREDVLYRLNVVKIELPSLRQRIEDIPLLVHHFLRRYTKHLNKKVLGVSNAAMRAMLSHPWRGNVRELENVIERAVIFSEDRHIEVSDLPFTTDQTPVDESANLRDALRQFERQHIVYTLQRCEHDKAETAKQLGIGLSSLYRKMEELDVQRNPPEERGDDKAPESPI
ncbi:MAG: sigma-54 dependent transcriptional regulator [Phycisphaeraceae bacterium]